MKNLLLSLFVLVSLIACNKGAQISKLANIEYEFNCVPCELREDPDCTNCTKVNVVSGLEMINLNTGNVIRLLPYPVKLSCIVNDNTGLLDYVLVNGVRYKASVISNIETCDDVLELAECLKSPAGAEGHVHDYVADTTVIQDINGNDSLVVFTFPDGTTTYTKCPSYVEPVGTTIEVVDSNFIITCNKIYNFDITDLITADCQGADYSVDVCSELPAGVSADIDGTILSIEVDCSCVDDTYSPFFFSYEATCDNSIATTDKGILSVDIAKIQIKKSGSYNPFASYTYEVCNIGSVPLTGVTVTDVTSTGQVVTVSGGPISLAVGQCDNTTFAGAYTPVLQDYVNGEIVNTATATGLDTNGNLVDDESDDNVGDAANASNNDIGSDSDGDGEEDDPTILVLDCDAIAAIGDLEIIKEIISSPNYDQTSDCDGGGVPDVIEIEVCISSGIPYDPFDPSDDACADLIANNVDVCAFCSTAGNENTDLCAVLDCDFGGLPNGVDCANGGDWADPSDDCSIGSDIGFDFCGVGVPIEVQQTIDCDGGGLPIYWDDCEGGAGSDTDPTDDCQDAIQNNAPICNIINGDPDHPFADLDCDGNGYPNLVECQNGLNPSDPDDDVTCVEILKHLVLVTSYAVGEDVEGTIEVRNCGPFEGDITVTDPHDPNSPVVVAGVPSGGVSTYTYTFQLTQADIDADSLVNQATADILDIYGKTDTDLSDDSGAGDSVPTDVAGSGTTEDDPSVIGTCPISASIVPNSCRVDEFGNGSSCQQTFELEFISCNGEPTAGSLVSIVIKDINGNPLSGQFGQSYGGSFTGTGAQQYISATVQNGTWQWWRQRWEAENENFGTYGQDIIWEITIDDPACGCANTVEVLIPPVYFYPFDNQNVIANGTGNTWTGPANDTGLDWNATDFQDPGGLNWSTTGGLGGIRYIADGWGESYQPPSCSPLPQVRIRPSAANANNLFLCEFGGAAVNPPVQVVLPTNRIVNIAQLKGAINGAISQGSIPPVCLGNNQSAHMGGAVGGDVTNNQMTDCVHRAASFAGVSACDELAVDDMKFCDGAGNVVAIIGLPNSNGSYNQ